MNFRNRLFGVHFNRTEEYRYGLPATLYGLEINQILINMSSSPLSSRDLYQIWMRIINKLNESESLPRYFGIDIPLYPSEVHTIQAVGDNPGYNVRTIAEVLGITPGAASQVITRLAKRGLIKKVRGKKNEKEVHLELTGQGSIAYQTHATLHERVYQRIADRIGPLTDEDILLLSRILRSVEGVYDERIIEVKTELSPGKSVQTDSPPGREEK